MKPFYGALWLLAPIVLTCGQPERASPLSQAERLPAGVLGRVGTEEVQARTVSRIVAQLGIAAADARALAMADALFASEARERLDPATVSTFLRAALGRALLEGLLDEAKRGGLPTDSEIDQITRERWVELDRPASARVTHVVALVSEGNEPAARRVAEALAKAVQGIGEPKAFIALAQAVPTDGVQVKAERLPPMTPAGRAFSLEGEQLRESHVFDRTFAEAANALAGPGSQSEIVQTRFGFHIILLETKVPELRVPLEDRRRILTNEVTAIRARGLKGRLVESLRAGVTVEVARDFEAWTASYGGS